jgi:hypothetical protein
MPKGPPHTTKKASTPSIGAFSVRSGATSSFTAVAAVAAAGCSSGAPSVDITVARSND